MTESQVLPPRTRRVASLLLIAVMLAYLTVAVSALVTASGLDPRETFGSRAAGFGFADWGRPVLFSPFAVVLPLLAVVLWTATRPVVLGLYGFLVVAQATVAVASLLFGLDVGGDQHEMAGRVFVDEWAAVERFVVDIATAALTCTAFVVAARWRRSAKGA